MSTTIDADPRQLWDLVADLPQMGRWSPECRGVSWKRRSRGPEVGARFRGHNRNGWRRWSTSGVIVSAEPGRRLAWTVSLLGLPLSRWTYEFETDGTGCRVTETWEDRQLPLTRPWMVGWLVTGVKARPERNADTMRRTLQQLTTAASIAGRRTSR